jgi:hypothetical protein
MALAKVTNHQLVEGRIHQEIRLILSIRSVEHEEYIKARTRLTADHTYSPNRKLPAAWDATARRTSRSIGTESPTPTCDGRERHNQILEVAVTVFEVFQVPEPEGS